MPPLKNTKQELFALFLSQGQSQLQAYVNAGYKKSHSAPNRLVENVGVKARVQELQARAVAKYEVDKVDIMRRLDANAKTAALAGEIAASNQALALMGKELGMFVEKQELKVDAARGPITDRSEGLLAHREMLVRAIQQSNGE